MVKGKKDWMWLIFAFAAGFALQSIRVNAKTAIETDISLYIIRL